MFQCFRTMRKPLINLVALLHVVSFEIKASKMLILEVIFPLTEALVVTVSETSAFTSRKYVAEQDIIFSNLSEALRLPWLHSSVFALEKTPQKC